MLVMRCIASTVCLASFVAYAQLATEVAQKAGPSVVFIKGSTGDGQVSGSGFLVSSDGKIVTNLHVIRDLKSGGVQLSTGEIYDSFTVLAFDERKDLAIIKVAAFDAPAIELGNSNQLVVGEALVAVGSPRGLTGTVTAGILSAVREEAGVKLLQTDAAVNPGNSGGPLLNGKAQVVGVVVAKLRASEGLNFAVPINYVRGMLADLPAAPMDLQTLRAKLETSKGEFKAKAGTPVLPERWKSLSNGLIRTVRLTGDHLYVELVPPMPPGSQFQMYEMTRQGNIFVGTRRDRAACTYRDPWFGTDVQNTCNMEFKVEIKSITNERIEGRILYPEKGNNLNCKKCSFAKSLTQWQEFTWIPE